MSQPSSTRYDNVAITLHWVMAISFLLMLASGVVMKYVTLEQSLKFSMYQWHKSLGVLLLVAFFLRIGWRLWHKPPALPVSFPAFERFAAHAGHWALYGFMLIMPLSGWLMASSSVYGLPTIVFGWFEFPHFPGIGGDEGISALTKQVHFFGAIGFGLMILAHAGAVAKHAVRDHVNLLPRMVWHKR
jgi:cytochrome b561